MEAELGERKKKKKILESYMRDVKPKRKVTAERVGACLRSSVNRLAPMRCVSKSFFFTERLHNRMWMKVNGTRLTSLVQLSTRNYSLLIHFISFFVNMNIIVAFLNHLSHSWLEAVDCLHNSELSLDRLLMECGKWLDSIH